MKKKFLSFLLLAVGLLMSSTAWAATVTVGTSGATYTDLSSAISAANAGDEIQLTTDVDFGTSTFTIDKNLTINLNGNTLQGAPSSQKTKVFTIDGVTFKLIGAGTFTMSNSYGICFFAKNNGTVIINQGTGNKLYVASCKYFAQLSSSGGTFSFQDGYYSTGHSMQSYNSSPFGDFWESGYYVYDTDNYGYKQVVDTKGTWNVISPLTNICTVNGTAYKTIDAAMEAALVDGAPYYPIVLTDDASCNTTIYANYTFENETGKDYTLSISSVENGTYDCKVEASSFIYGGTFKKAVKSTSSINGGTFDGAVTQASYITGGTFNSTASANNIKGGVFANQPSNIVTNYDYATNSDASKYMVASADYITNHKVTKYYFETYYNVKNFVGSTNTVLNSGSKDYVVLTEDVKDSKVYKGAYSYDLPSDILADGYMTAGVRDASNNYFCIIGKNISTESSTSKVTAGVFNMDPTTYVEDPTKYGITKSTDGKTWTVALVAGLGDVQIVSADGTTTTEYGTLALALGKVQNGETIELKKDIEMSGNDYLNFSSVSGKAFTLDLKNHHISSTYKDYPIYLYGTVTIKGTADSYIKGSSYCVYIYNRNQKVIFDPSFEGKIDQGFSGSTSASYKNIVIKGGYFKNTINISDYVDGAYTIDATALDGYNKIVPLTEANADCEITDASNNVVGYYKLTSNTASTIASAWCAANGNKLTLLKSNTAADISMTLNPGAGNTIYLDLNGKTLTTSAEYCFVHQSGILTIQSSEVGGAVNVTNTSALAAVVYNVIDINVFSQYSTTVNILGGSFNKNIYGQTVNVSDGVFETNGIGGYSQAVSTLNIHGGTFNAGIDPQSTVNIDGGNILGNYFTLQQGHSHVAITGGYLGSIVVKNNADLTITGGEFKNDPSEFLDRDNYKAVLQSNGRYMVMSGTVTVPDIVDYLESTTRTGTYTLTKDIDLLTSYTYNVIAVGTKTIDLAGHELKIPRGRWTVSGTLNMTNSSTTTQGRFVTPNADAVDILCRAVEPLIDVKGTLNVTGDVYLYGRTKAIMMESNSTLKLDGTTVEACYDGAVTCNQIGSDNVTININNANITSASSEKVNGGNSWSYAVRPNGQNNKVTITNTKVTGVHGAVGISGTGTVATITGCDLQAHNTKNADGTNKYEDCFAALYAATNATVNVYSTLMKSEREDYSAYNGNNDNTEFFAIINLYAGCYLQDKLYMEETDAYGLPAEGPWVDVAQTGTDKTYFDAGYRYKVEAGTVQYVTVYSPNQSGVEETLTLDGWRTKLAQYPNTIGVVDYSGYSIAKETKNLVVKRTIGGKDRYVCPNLVLTDLANWEGHAVNRDNAIKTGFICPNIESFTFTAVKGSYTRSLTEDSYNTICVPFAITPSMFGTNELLTFSNYQENENTVNLAYVTSNVDPGVGVIVKPSASTKEWTVNFDNTKIVGDPNTGIPVHGVFKSTEYDSSLGYYSVNGSGYFQLIGGYLHPFRACFSLDGTVNASTRLVTPDMIITPGIQTGLDELNSAQQDGKFMQNGKLFIRHNGQIYDAAGKLVK